MIRLKRQKRRNYLLSFFYKLRNYLPLSPVSRLKLFLDLSWIFSRLAHEQIFNANVRLPENIKNDFLINHIWSNSKILDIGCGQGFIINQLKEKTTDILGVDLMPASIEKARTLINEPDIKLICTDIFDYLSESADEKFDCIILSHVLEHIENPFDFLIRLKLRAVYFYIEVPDWEASHLNLFRQLVGTDLIYSDSDHVSEFDRDSIESIFELSGFKTLKSEFRFGVMKYWLSSAQ